MHLYKYSESLKVFTEKVLSYTHAHIRMLHMIMYFQKTTLAADWQQSLWEHDISEKSVFRTNYIINSENLWEFSMFGYVRSD